MSGSSHERNRRILIIDDQASIHEDFRTILCGSAADNEELNDASNAFLGTASQAVNNTTTNFEVESAYQGEEGLELVHKAEQAGKPYAAAFVDVRMPPGWDGIETVQRIWQDTPDLQVVLCTAYSDYSWDEMIEKLGQSDHLLVLKKPFDPIEVTQLACALSAKWDLARKDRERVALLEEAVRNRTRELEEQRNELEDALSRLQEAHSQLLQSEKMASIGQLAAGVAHEINNPIGFVSSNLNSLDTYMGDLKRVLQAYDTLIGELSEEPTDVPDKVSRARTISDAVDLEFILSDINDLLAESAEGTQRVRKIVADLKDFSHVDAPDLTEEDINNLLDKTINVAWSELKYKAEIVKEYQQIPRVKCFGGKIGQVFLNLLVNAAQAMEERGTITINTESDGSWVSVSIADTGSGIAPDVMGRIFDPFFTTKEIGKGTGLGLHLAYKILEAHGGQLEAESEVGKGTTFRMRLPVGGPPEQPDSGGESVVKRGTIA